MFKFFRSKFVIAISLLFALLLAGVFGYRFIGGYNWLDAMYMTIITVSTVGYRELMPPDSGTKLFTVILVLSSLFIIAYAISVITEYVLSRSTFENIKFRKMKKSVEQLQDHVIICGYGRNGQQAAVKLRAYKRPFVIVERDRELIEKEERDFLFIHGNANEDEVLLEAGIKKASCLITTLPNDSDNLFVVLSSRQLNGNLKIISRASLEATQRKLILAGANKTIMPDKIGGDHMASLVVLPDLIEFMDQLSIEGENSINLEEIAVDDLPEDYINKSLADLDLRKKSGCTVIGFKAPEGTYLINPDASTRLLPHAKLMVLGRPEQIQKLNNILFADS
ncbi:potassium channel family protein [Robertkochia aurantiaca]|uniref:potassium channel family protein n=1 Tax=Robertkochia aurantiaca TaxID=2873700 RepID=UPI001CCA89FC|nr:potassium channel protein [Robertkochia sp. 3YJGBD-33]